MYYGKTHRRRSKGKGKGKGKKRGGSMVGRLAVPAGLLILLKMMHSRKVAKKSGKSSKRGKTMRRKGTRLRR
jgi:hypothetical protein